MRYLALVTDYEGTIASKGRASASAFHAIARLRASGRRYWLRPRMLLFRCPRQFGLFRNGKSGL